MRGFLFYAALIALVPGNIQGMEPEGTVDKLDSAVVEVSRAGSSTPVAYTMVSREDLRASNPLNSLPMTLSMQPSVISVNEGGTGLGYSKLTVRGVKGSQINVTLNGVTLNDAESQEVFWVNIPALSNLLSSVQLQRGLGTSASGPGAFGASINMSTASVGADPYGYVDLGYGSYDTFTATASAGTGVTDSGLYLDFAYSRGMTDGYIRNAFADVQSAMGVLGWMNDRNSLRLTWLYGDQRTGITWHGIDLEQYESDRRYNPAGEYHDKYGNVRYYDNDTDNYTQHHLQLSYTRRFAPGLVWASTFNWTRGHGFFENYLDDGYRLDLEGDIIVKEALKNDYFVLNSDLKYSTENLSLVAGINLSSYDGDHIGNLKWSEVLGDSYDYESYSWYLNNGLKREANAFVRAEFMPYEWMTAYADLQYRGISLMMQGPEDDQVPLDYSTLWNFLNPRAGITFNITQCHKAFVSAAFGHREPGRSDIKENIKNSYWAQQAGVSGEEVSLKPEKMLDVELGYAYSSESLAASANIYLMEYRDMLLETGRLSNVGYAIKENVARSWRRGVELAASWKALPWLHADANLTLSVNQIKDYSEFVQHVDTYSDWRNTGRTTRYDYGTVTMLMSPSVSGMGQLTITPFRGTSLMVNGKYVGKQYLDNTMSDTRSVPAYFVTNLSLGHEFAIGESRLGLSLHVSNLLDRRYYADGWCYKNIVEEDGALCDGVGIYPQAPINFMLRMNYRF